MARSILIIQGHPDPRGGHLGHALAQAYAEGAGAAGYNVHEVTVAALDFPWLQRPEDFEQGDPPPAIHEVQQLIMAADHVVFFHPLWLGEMPAILKAMLEQTLRPVFVTGSEKGLGGFGARRLKGRSARIVVTMGMPALFYRVVYRAHGVKSFRRNILRFCGFSPVRITLIGLAGGGERRRSRWLQYMRRLGAHAN